MRIKHCGSHPAKAAFPTASLITAEIPKANLRHTGITLDKLYDNYFDGEIVDIRKLDVETAEFDVIKHPEEYQMLKKCRYVIMEIHLGDGRELNDILEPFEELGFERHDPRPGDDPHVYFFVNRILAK